MCIRDWAVVAWGAAAGASEWQSGKQGNMILTASLTGGVDGSNVTDANKIEAYQKFKNAEEVEIGILLGGETSSTVALELISIAEGRKDCVSFISPEKSDVVNNAGLEADAVVDLEILLDLHLTHFLIVDGSINMTDTMMYTATFH